MVDNPTSGPSPSLRQRCLAIELLVVDVDGVLTDGGIIHADNNAELKKFPRAAMERDSRSGSRWESGRPFSRVAVPRSWACGRRRSVSIW